jgi:acetyltransferase-like isoleucine patch superfamily enzyme
VVLDVQRDAVIRVGDATKVMHYAVIAANSRVDIGSFVQIADNSTVRDNNHEIRVGLGFMTDLPTVTSDVFIGDDVWIGRGCAVLAGALIGEGAVIGANAVVTGTVPPKSISAGVPARQLRMRPEGRPTESGPEGPIGFRGS